MMTVALAVSGDIDQRAGGSARTLDAIDESLTREQRTFECDRARDRTVIAEDCERASGSVTMEVAIWDAWIDRAVADVYPPILADWADPRSLMRRQDRVSHPGVDQRAQSGVVACGLGQPHRLGLTTEVMVERNDAPRYLGLEVAPIAERQDRMIVRLSDRVAVAMARVEAHAVGGADARPGPGMRPLKPAHQRWPEVEAYRPIVVDDAVNRAPVVEDPREGVGSIAFGINAFIPVMKGAGAILGIERSSPRILARRLIKMTMNDDRIHWLRHRQ